MLRSKDPYISFVVAGRNDNYGGDYLQRVQLCINVLFSYWQRFKLDAELIIVEWNPPADSSPLAEAISWRRRPDTGTVRIITVPQKIHMQIPNPNKMPIFEYLAKNVGIRRATGRFVVVMNPDIILTKDMIRAFAEKVLRGDCYYRADRYDFRPLLPPWLPVDLIETLAKWLVCQMPPRRFSLKQRLIYHYTGRWPSVDDNWLISSANEPAVSCEGSGPHFPHGVHIMCSGDFIIAPRLDWHRIHGYPQFTHTFAGIDPYGCFQLKATGLHQMLFRPPCMILHADHGRAEHAQRKSISWEQVLADLDAIHLGTLNPVFNDENWGLAQSQLDEQRIEHC